MEQKSVGNFLLFSILTGIVLSGCAVPLFERQPIDPVVYINPEIYSDNTDNHGNGVLYSRFIDQFDSSRYTLPGMAILLEDRQYGVWVGTQGFLDLEYQIPWEKNSTSKIGSISKSFGSVICLKLQEQGFFDLDDPIFPYLAGVDLSGIANVENASIRQVLNHTSGIPDNLRNPVWVRDYLYVEERMFSNVLEALNFARGLEARFTPGNGFEYSNTNYDLIQLLIEQVTGKPVSQVIEEMITIPLGMRSTYLPLMADVPEGVARGYNDYFCTGHLTDVTPIELSSNVLEGGLVSNVYDLAIFIKAVAFNEEFLRPESRRQMMERGHEDATILSGMDPLLNDYEGLGMSVMDYNGKTYLCNAGGCKGYTAYIAACLETGDIFALMVNGQGGRVGWTVFNGILKGVLNDIAP